MHITARGCRYRLVVHIEKPEADRRLPLPNYSPAARKLQDGAQAPETGARGDVAQIRIARLGGYNVIR